MSVLWWFVLGTSVAAYLCSWRYIAGRIAWHEKGRHQDHPDADDIAWGLFAGVFLALLVPVIVAVEFVYRRLSGDFLRRRLLYTPPQHREELRR